jgi:DNA helicase-2/ATP-dependent DNA helicase PcrA
VVGAVSFFERKEVKDVVGYLRLLTNANADSAFERVVNVPARGIGETTVDRLRAAARASGWGLYEAARSAARGEIAGLGAPARKKLISFCELIEGLRDVIAQGASVAETIIQVVDRSGLRGKLESDDTAEARDRLDNLAELVSTATDFDDESDQPQTTEAFLERIALSSPSDNSADRDQVVLMTIHIAKGLEWPVVFITGMEDGLFPSLREREGVSEDAALEEERRLAYVAITRARQRLLLSFARTRRQWGEIRVQGPSRFIQDLPASSVATGPRKLAPGPRGPRILDGNFAAASGTRIPKARRTRDEFDQRSAHAGDDEPVFDVDSDLEHAPAARGAEQFRTGDAVSHALHGTGKVLAVSGAGKDRKVIVEFATVGTKTVFAKYLTTDELN